MNPDQRIYYKDLRRFFKLLTDCGLWESMQTDFQTQLLYALQTATTPEEAYKTAIKAQILSEIFVMIADRVNQQEEED